MTPWQQAADFKNTSTAQCIKQDSGSLFLSVPSPHEEINKSTFVIAQGRCGQRNGHQIKVAQANNEAVSSQG